MSSGRVRAALHVAADTYQPDRAAILARIRAGQAGLDASRTPRLHRRRVAVRAAAIAATVAAVLGLSVAVTWAAVGNPVTRQRSHPGSAVAPAPTDSPGLTQGHGGTGRASSTANVSRSPVASASSTRVQQGFLWSSGAIDPHSIDNWAQSNVTLRNSETVTALVVRVRIVLTPSVSSTGTWSTVPAEDLVTTVEQQSDALVYQFTLKPGVNLAPGSYVFAVQYAQAVGGRDHSNDSYQATATAGATRAEVYGRF